MRRANAGSARCQRTYVAKRRLAKDTIVSVAVMVYRLWWQLGAVVAACGAVGLINEVTVRQARLVLGWVTVFGRVYHLCV